MEDQGDVLGVLTSCVVPECQHGNDRPLLSSDFDEYKSLIDNRLASISSAFLGSPLSSQLNDDVLARLVVVCGQHSTSSLWTTDLSIALCNDMFENVSTDFEKQRGHAVFHDARLLRKALVVLRHQLLSSTFKCYPAAVTCYSWILRHIKSPFLGECLSDLLPSALIISDDFEPHNIKIGFDCLHHIIENVALERLKWYGQDEVILDALKKSLYQTDPEIVSSQLPCYVSLMKKHIMSSSALKANQFDEVIKTTLFNMFVESNLKLRRIYISSLAKIIEARGLGVVRHLSMLFKVLSEYTLEPTTSLDSIKALDQIVRVCWSRGPTVCDGIVTILTKLLINLSVDSSKFDVDIVVSTSQNTGKLLRTAFPNQVAEFLLKFCDSAIIDEKLIKLVQRVFS